MPYYDSKPPVPVGMGRHSKLGLWGNPVAVRWLVAIMLVVLGGAVGGAPVPPTRGLAQTDSLAHSGRLTPAPRLRNGTRSSHHEEWHREQVEWSWRTESRRPTELVRLAAPGRARSLAEQPASDWKMVIFGQF